MEEYKRSDIYSTNPVWKDKTYMEYFQLRYQLADELLQYIKEGNEFQALNILDKRNCLGKPGLLKSKLDEWRYDTLQLEGVIMYALHGGQVTDAFLDEIHADFIKKMERVSNVMECSRLEEETVKKFCEIHRYRTMHSNSVLVQKILVTVDMDLTQPLTLQYFSEKLNVNSSYLSNLFRVETGRTITEYVTQRRIHHAAGLLQTTQYPVRMIAELVGIPDVHYFSKLFKRHTGKPPSQYREK